MGPWDGVEVDSDGDELLDWLWDLPDRYDVGIEDDPEPAFADPAATLAVGAVGAGGAAGVRKHLRAAGEPRATVLDDTVAVEQVAPAADTADDDYEFDYDAAFTPAMSAEPRPPRFTTRELAAAAAVLVVVVAGAGLGYSLFSKGSGKGSKPSNLAIGTPSTTATTLVLNSIPPVTLPTTVDTTPTTGPPVTATPPASVPGVLPADTTTTAPQRCVVHMAMILPMVADQADPTSTTTTTVPATTTTTLPTTTTAPPTTTTQPPPTTPPPTTLPHPPPTTRPPAPPTTARCH
ncbi:MAG: hypothetical protein QOG44_3387 [Acidimicrobiaceae bacterium]|nr:hypothetical protein [Acidimicrobiaceae bacterium]